MNIHLKQNPKDKIHYSIVNQDYTFTDLHELKKYYPTIEYESIIDQYHLNSIRVLNFYGKEIDRYELEVDKVYTHE